MRHRRSAFVAVVLGLLAGSVLVVERGTRPAVASTMPPKSRAQISFRRDLLPMFETNCAMCHQDSVAMGGLSLLPHVARDMLVQMPSSQSDMMRVAPGRPERSYLVRKLEGTHVAARGKGLPMPIGQRPLTAGELGKLRFWITQGAPDN